MYRGKLLRAYVLGACHVLYAGCASHDVRSSEDEFDENDAGESDAAVSSDASSADATTADASAACTGQGIAQLICALGQPTGTQAGQPDLQTILGILTQLGGQLGTPPANGERPPARPGVGTPPSEEQCAEPADQLTEFLCGVRRDGGTRMRRPDGGVPPGRPADGDAGTPTLLDAGFGDASGEPVTLEDAQTTTPADAALYPDV
jgi:hypothetical protein